MSDWTTLLNKAPSMAIAEFSSWLIAFAREIDHLPGCQIEIANDHKLSEKVLTIPDNDLRGWAMGWAERLPRDEHHKLVEMRARKVTNDEFPSDVEKMHAAELQGQAEAQLILQGRSAREVMSAAPKST
jgi:hypothetical protein